MTVYANLCSIVWRCEEPRELSRVLWLGTTWPCPSPRWAVSVQVLAQSVAQVEQRETSRGVESVMNRESPQHVWMIYDDFACQTLWFGLTQSLIPLPVSTQYNELQSHIIKHGMKGFLRRYWRFYLAVNVCLSESLEAVAMNESQLITGEAVTFVFVHGGVASRAFTLMRMMHLVYAGSKHFMLYIYIHT